MFKIFFFLQYYYYTYIHTIIELKKVSNIQGHKQFLLELNTKSKGFAASTTLTMMGEMGNRIKANASAWKNLGQNLAKAISPLGNLLLGLTTALANLLSFVTKSKFLTGAIIGFIALKTVTFAYRSVVAGLTLMFRQLQSSMSSYTASSLAGYSAMGMAAKNYAVTQRLSGIGFFGGTKSAIGVTVERSDNNFFFIVVPQ